MATPIPVNSARFTLAEIAALTGGELIAAHGTAVVLGVSTDSRTATQGNLYVALRGELHDGHAYIAQARARGAAAALVERNADVDAALPRVVVEDTLVALGALARAHRLRWAGRVVGITGSAGKTTTKELTAAALAAAGARVAKTQGNLNNLIGVPMTLLALDASSDVAVIEMGTNAHGEIEKLAAMAMPDVGVITTVGLAHTAGLGTLAEVAHEKCALLRALPVDGTAIFCADVPALVPELSAVRAKKRMLFGASSFGDVVLMATTLTDALMTRAQYRVYGNIVSAELSVLGDACAIDAGAAMSVVLALFGAQALSKAIEGLLAVKAVDGRLFPKRAQNGALVIDDTYNANPSSMLASLQTLAQLAATSKRRAVAVLGDMAELGDVSTSEHARVVSACDHLGIALLVGCGAEMARAVAATPCVRTHAVGIDALEDAVTVIKTRVDANDVVLVKGSRSMRMERCVDALVPKLGGTT
jgi:UDP-N-acetylmuramoyl-tripeptide--D-alanyl-D-alanine ligase